MFKISHEVPEELLQVSRSFNDYDYALVHLFEKNEQYYNFFKESLERGRTVILDNSAFELGKPYDLEKYQEYILKLKPTEYVLPDYRDNSKKNLESIQAWDPNIPGIKIGVVHGEDYERFAQNYKDIAPYVDKIAFSFESFFDFIKDTLQHENLGMTREFILGTLASTGVIDRSKSHHILGAFTPQEFQRYKEVDWIESIDTSNPVVHGYLGIRYEPHGLDKKQSLKLADMLDADLTMKQEEDIYFNIRRFREQMF